MEPVSPFSAKFNQAFEASSYSSHRKLSLDSDCNPSQAGKIARGEFDDSRDGPALFSTHRMAENMGVSLNCLCPPVNRDSGRPHSRDFFSRYRGENTPIKDFKDIIEYCDLYEQPRMGRCKLLWQGSHSLLTERTGLRDVEKQQSEYDAWPSEQRAAIFNWQRQAWTNGAMAMPVYFEGNYGFRGLNLKGYILRCACRVLDDDLKPRLLFFGEMLWQEERSARNQ